MQSACLDLLEPRLEPTFSRFSYAFRPHRSAHHAIEYVRSVLRAGRVWVVESDIRRCFDEIVRYFAKYRTRVDEHVGAALLDTAGRLRGTADARPVTILARRTLARWEWGLKGMPRLSTGTPCARC